MKNCDEYPEIHEKQMTGENAVKQNIKKPTVCLLVVMVLLCCIPTFAVENISVEWNTSDGSISLADTLDGEIPTTNNLAHNTVKVTYAGKNEGVATLIIVPVINGEAVEPTPENTVLVTQELWTEGEATFGFYLKPSIGNGIYAMHLGGMYDTYITKYFRVNIDRAPKLAKGQILQYDDYKNEITLKFKTSSDESFERWTTQKSNMTVSLSAGEKFAEIHNDDITFDAVNGTMTIDTTDYGEILPSFGSRVEGNIQQTTISIATQDYWGDDGLGSPVEETFGLVIPEISAEGFAQGIDVEITVASNADMQGVSPIIALYDNNVIVDCLITEEIDLVKDVDSVLPIKFKCDGVSESGNFVIKVFLWDSSEVRPITPIIKFPQ